MSDVVWLKMGISKFRTLFLENLEIDPKFWHSSFMMWLLNNVQNEFQVYEIFGFKIFIWISFST